jgi:hypothetical protein
LPAVERQKPAHCQQQKVLAEFHAYQIALVRLRFSVFFKPSDDKSRSAAWAADNAFK